MPTDPSPAIHQPSPAEVLRAWAERECGDVPEAALAVLTELQCARDIAEDSRMHSVRIARQALKYRAKNLAVRAALAGYVCPDGTPLAERVRMLRSENRRLEAVIATLRARAETVEHVLQWLFLLPVRWRVWAATRPCSSGCAVRLEGDPV